MERLTEEQKRAMVQEKEKPGVADGGCLPPHGIATSQLFRCRVQFGLTTRETPQLAKVILADGVVNQVSALSTLRDLVPPQGGMTAIMLEIARSRHDGADITMRRSTLSEGRGVRWRAIWPFRSSVPRGTYVGRRWQPGAVKTRHSALAHLRRPSFVLVRSGSFMNIAGSWAPAAVLTSRRGLGRNSVRFRSRLWSASSQDRPAEDVHAVGPADTARSSFSS
jgi:hypothetical protein